MVCFHTPRGVNKLHFLFADWTHFVGKMFFFWPEKMPEAAARHNTLVLRTKTLLASMARECTDRTSRRAEVPPPEESTKGGGCRRRPSAASPFVERREAQPPLVEESQPSSLFRSVHSCAMLAKNIFFPLH